MGGRIAALAAFLLAQGFAQIGIAQGGARGADLAFGTPRRTLLCTITAVDSVSTNFVCQTNRVARKYWTARSTHFVTVRPNASFFDLKTGQPVRVTFHDAGRLAIADVVQF